MTDDKDNRNPLYVIMNIYSDTLKLKQRLAFYTAGYNYVLKHPNKTEFEMGIVPIVRNTAVLAYVNAPVYMLPSMFLQMYHNVTLPDIIIFNAYIANLESTLNREGYLILKRTDIPSKGVLSLEILN